MNWIMVVLAVAAALVTLVVAGQALAKYSTLRFPWIIATAVAGAGLRVDINEVFSLQISYNRVWLDLGGSADKPDFDSIRIDFIGRAF